MDALRSSADKTSAEQALQTFLDQYHLKAHVLPFTAGPFLLSDYLEDKDLPVLIAFGRIFICEYAKYSQLWVSTSRIKGVAFVRNLKKTQTSLKCEASGTVNFATWTVYHSIECGADIPNFQENTVHHEFWHTMSASIGDYDDPAWVAFNDPAFAYGIENYPRSGGYMSVPNHPGPGFINYYAMTNEAEDQAVTYATLFVPEQYKDALAWEATDPILKKKVDYLKQLIANYDPTLSAYFERTGQ